MDETVLEDAPTPLTVAALRLALEGLPGDTLVMTATDSEVTPARIWRDMVSLPLPAGDDGTERYDDVSVIMIGV